MDNKNKHKRAFLTWLAIYPLITLIFSIFGEDLVKIPLILRTLILTIVVVPLMSYLLLPFYYKIFNKWMNK
jgi:antibiotic biosynthesis monooxygenase (ABM) superfamily enzyme